MSFGFSISDFTAAAGLAYSLYKKCKEADERYDALSKQIQFLGEVLSDIEDAFREDGKVPKDRPKVRSLVTAKDMSLAVLEEVDLFLDKHAGIASENNSVFDIIKYRLKFISSDVKELEDKVVASARMLQLSLITLSALSINKLPEKMEIVWSEQQQGLKEPSVISRTLVDGLPTSKDDVFQQFVYDLEEKDVHPDCLSLNQDYIYGWISEHMPETAFASTEYTAADRINPQIDRHAMPSFEKSSAPVPAKDTNSISSSLIDTNASLTPQPKTQSKPDKTSAAIFDEVSLRPQRPLSVCSDVSVSSHRSKPEDWRPFDGPHPEYAFDMLLSLFQDHTEVSLQPETSRRRITRAFHQLDWTRRGYLTRNETIQVCTEILERRGIKEADPRITGLVRDSDWNHDGRISKDEFVVIIDSLVQSSDSKSRNAQRKLNSYVHELDMSPISYIELIETHGITPWGCEAQVNNERTIFLDLIDQSSVTNATVYSKMPDAAFTGLAIQADECVKTIDNFEKTWLSIVPTSMTPQFVSALGKLRDAALHYVVFEKWNQQDGQMTRALSDLDAILICHLTLARVQRTPVHLSGFLLELQDLREKAMSYSRALRAICSRLEAFGVAKIEPIPWNFPKFQQMWRDEHIEAMADEINSQDAEWFKSKIMTTLKNESQVVDQARSEMEPAAISTLRAYDAFVRRTTRFLDSSAFKVRFRSIDWRGSETSKNSRFNLLLDSKIVLRFRATVGIDGHYEPEQEIGLLDVYPSTKLQFEQIGVNKNGTSLLCNTEEIEARQITGLCDPARKACHTRFKLTSSVVVDDYDCKLIVTADVCDQTEIAQEIERLRSTKWTDFLQMGHDIDPRFRRYIDSLPNGVEMLFDNKAGGLYFFHRGNRTSTWTKPPEPQSLSSNQAYGSP